MTVRLFFVSLLLTLLSWGHCATAQTAARRGQTYWYTVHDNVIVQKTGSTYKVIKDELTLPNGSRLLPLTRHIRLASGEQVLLGQNDVVTPSGELIRTKEPEPAAATTATAPTAPTGFAYVPTAPVNGKLKGVVELGASGFNSFIIRADAQRNWKLEKSEFGNSLVLENMATDDDIRRGLKAYISKMIDYGVNGRNIYFVVSSGAAEASGTQNIVKNLRALNYVVHVVTPEQEGEFGLRATLPPAYAGKAFFVDMGSANTKIAWPKDDKATVLNTYGSKYYQTNATEANVASDVADKAQLVPTDHRQTCFIIGGVPFELAKSLRQGKEPYTVLHAPEGYPELEGAKLKAGLTIYRALAAATGCQQFVFDWNANFTIGYLLQTP